MDPEIDRRELAARRATIGASAFWATPLQVVAIVATGGMALFLALRGRWQVWDWLFVVLCAFYVVNAVVFARLTRRRGP